MYGIVSIVLGTTEQQRVIVGLSNRDVRDTLLNKIMKRVAFLSVVFGMVVLLTLSVAGTGWANHTEGNVPDVGDGERAGGMRSQLLIDRSNDHDESESDGPRAGGQ